MIEYDCFRIKLESVLFIVLQNLSLAMILGYNKTLSKLWQLKFNP